MLAFCYASASIERDFLESICGNWNRVRRSSRDSDYRQYGHGRDSNHRQNLYGRHERYQDHIEQLERELRGYKQRLNQLRGHEYDTDILDERYETPLLGAGVIATEKSSHRRPVTKEELYQLVGKISNALLQIEHEKHINARLKHLRSAQRIFGDDPHFIVNGQFSISKAENIDCELIIRDNDVDQNASESTLTCGPILYQATKDDSGQEDS